MNDTLYKLFLQHDKANNIKNWIVRLEAKVDDDGLVILKQYAKEFKGYCSSSQGVDEFMFKTIYQARQYCKRLDECLQENDDSYELDLPNSDIVEDNNASPKVKSDSDTKEISLDCFCSSLKKIIENEGAKILLCDSTFKIIEGLKKSNALNNLPPSIEFILRTVIMKKYSQPLLAIKKWRDEYKELVNNFVYDTGLNEDLSTVVFECLAYAIGKISQIKHILVETSALQKEQSREIANIITSDYNIKDFYYCHYLKQQNLWCVIFEVDKHVGNPAFALFRKDAERIGNMWYNCVKVANGIGFSSLSEREEFLRIFKNSKKHG